MTIVLEIKKCPKCHKKYSWNPVLGSFSCPHCHGLGKGKESILDKIKKRFISGDGKEK